MKKFFLIIAACTAIALVSCNKEVPESVVHGRGDTSEQSNEGGASSEFFFSVSRELPATKAYLEENDFLWEDGDEIAVCYGSSVVKFTYSASTEKFGASAFDETATGPFYIVAPYSEGITITSDGKVSAELPAQQTAGAKGLDPAALLSVGKAESVEALSEGVTLKNAFSLVKVGISDTDVNRISIDGNYSGTTISPVLAGPVVIDPATGTASVSGRTTSVSLVPSEGNLAAGDYIIAVAPQTMSAGIKVVFRRAEEAQSYYRISSKSIAFERNKGVAFAAVNTASLSKRCYFVTDADDMMAWASAGSYVGSDNVFLGADIDLDGKEWTPVNYFAGTFDGQNHRIYNIAVTGNQYVGFIRINLGPDEDEGEDPADPKFYADIKNFSIGSKDGTSWDGVSHFTHSASANNYTWYYVGVVAKTQAAATMENVTNFAKVEVAEGSNGKTRAAGICGNWASTGAIKNCYNYGDVVNNATATGQASSSNNAVATSILGGVIAQCDAAVEITECENHGTVTNNNPYVKWVGGIIGNSGQALTVKKCINYGTLKNTVQAYTSWLGTGGIAGYLSKGTIDACQTVDASVSSVCHVVGGIAAQVGGAIKDCVVSNSKITGSNNFPAGILAYCATNGVKVTGCKVIGKTVISGMGEIGGIGGRFNASVLVQNCEFSNSTINATGEDAGGIIGWSQNGVVVDGCTVKDVTISSSANYTGGIVGLAEKTSFKGCVVDNAKVTGLVGTGGIVGYMKNAGTFDLDGCLVKGSAIKGTHSVGGVAGYAYGNSNTNVINVSFYNCGTDAATTITATASDGTPPGGDSMIAGICGWIRCAAESTFKVVNCYCNAKIICEQMVTTPSAGGVFGYCSLGSGSGEISNFSSSLTAERLQVGGSPVDLSADRVGAICGMLPNKAIQVNNCQYIDNLGIGAFGASVVATDCSSYSEAVYKDGTTVPAKLNAFASTYTGYTLKSWTADASGLPVLAE